MATKPKAILSTHDGREASPITKASNVLFENGQTAQDILNDRQDAMISPVIENSSSMFKVGQGDDVDYSANVVNGAYESMVLKGKTMVNCIQEPSSQDVVLPYEFEDGQYVTINDTKESGALGVELKGQTLVNLSHTKDEVSSSVSVATTIENITNVKPNTDYICFVNIKSSNPLSGITINQIFRVEMGAILGGVVGDIPTNYTTKYFIFNTGDRTSVNVVIRNAFTDASIGLTANTVHVKDVMILEYQKGMKNWDIPYFTGMTSCKMPILRTVGKNLFDTTTQKLGSYWSSTNTYITRDGSYISDTYVKVTTGQKLRANNTSGSVQYMEFDSNKNFIQRVNVSPNNTYTVPNNVSYLRFSFYDCGEGYQCQVEEGTSSTTYEAHKSSILSLPEEVVLKDINGIKDTLNCNTGEYVQRIEEKVFDGSEKWVQNGQHADGSYRHICNTYTDAKVSSDNVLCDKMSFVKVNGTTGEGMISDIHITYTTSTGKVQIATTKTLAELKTWLSQNPITVQYELATPIVTKINLSSTLKSWNTTTHIYSEIPENTLYPILSHSNPSYPVILKPSTRYSIVANSYSNSHTNSAINFNLGGATASTKVGHRVTTITTPSTLTSEELVMSGRGSKLNNVMVIEGDVVGDEPYFEGICDCKSPILSNVGKNLVNVDRYTLSCGSGVELNGYEKTVIAKNIKVKPNTKYIFSYGKTVNIPSHIRLKVMTLTDVVNEDIHVKVYKHKNRITEHSVSNGEMFTTESHARYIAITTGNFTTTGDILIEDIQIEEGSATTPYEPYKSNILSANGDKIELTEDMFEQGTINANVNQSFEQCKGSTTQRLRSKELLQLKQGVYSISIPSDYSLIVASFRNGLYESTSGWQGSNYTLHVVDTSISFGFIIKKNDNTTITTANFNESHFEIREVDKTIVLRSLPNGVCDTLNVETGEYVQRIGELVMSGSLSEEWQVWTGTQNTESVYTFQLNRCNNEPSGTMSVCDKYLTYFNASKLNATLGEGVALNTGNGYLRILKTKVGSGSVDELKTYLASNPITVQYELTTPIIKTVDLSGYPFSYENGHVILSSGSIEQSLTPTVEYSVATNRNGQIRSNQKMVERHQKQLDQLQAIILANLVNSQYNQTLTTLKYELSRV